MSFILEALKKSENKRQDGTVPGLETVHNSLTQPPAKSPRWVWLLLFVLILNVVVILWLFVPWQQQATIAQNLEQSVVLTPPLTLDPPVQANRPQPTEPQMGMSDKESIPIRTQPTEKNHELPPLVNPAEKPLRNTDLDIGQKKIYLVKELPISIRSDLPEMHMSLHAFYSNKPEASLVRVNDQIMRTGARLTGKYELVEITSEGAVFLYAGYRFLLPRKKTSK